MERTPEGREGSPGELAEPNTERKQLKSLQYLTETHSFVLVAAEELLEVRGSALAALTEIGWLRSVWTRNTRPAAEALTRYVAQKPPGRRIECRPRCLMTRQTGGLSGPSADVFIATHSDLLESAVADPLFRQFDLIVLEQTGERPVDMEILVCLLKRVVKIRKELRVVLCFPLGSATISEVSGYLREDSRQTDGGFPEVAELLLLGPQYHSGAAPVIEVLTLKEPCEDFIATAVATVLRLHEQESLAAGGIFVLMPGKAEAEAVASELLTQLVLAARERGVDPSRYDFDVTCVSRETSSEIVADLYTFCSSEAHRRAIIVATMAEFPHLDSKLPNIGFVVDSGLARLPIYDYSVAVTRQADIPVPADVSAVRARLVTCRGAGKCLRLVPESWKSPPTAELFPEAARVELSSVVLKMKVVGIRNLFQARLLTRFDPDRLGPSLASLFDSGCLDGDGNLTRIGTTVGRLLVARGGAQEGVEAVRVAAGLVKAVGSAVYEEMLLIAALFFADVELFAESPKDGELSFQELKLKYQHVCEEGDLVSALNVLRGFQEEANRVGQAGGDQRMAQWCRKRYLHYGAVRAVLRLRDELQHQMTELAASLPEAGSVPLPVGVDESSPKLEVLNYHLLDTFRQNVGRFQKTDGSIRLESNRGGQQAWIYPKSVLFHRPIDHDAVLLFGHVIEAKDKFYCRLLHRVDPVHFNRYLYDLKR